MIKILIVDDEILVRVGLRSAIDWYGNGFQIVGEASNGKEALDLIMECKPDILLMDIKMPVMDGIELMEIIKQRKIAARTIVLSCHDDYEYVREALKLGASDYLLKLSLNPQNLLNMLLEIKNEIETTSEGAYVNNDEKLEENWHKLLYQYNAQVWEEQLKYGIKLKDDKLVILSLSIDKFRKLCENGQFKDRNLLNSSVKGILNNIINDYACGDSFTMDDGKYAVIVNSENSHSKSIEQMIQNLQDALNRYVQVTVSVGISDAVESPEQLSIAYRQSYEALNKRFFNGIGSVVYYRDLKGGTPKETDLRFGMEYESELKRAIDLNDSDKAIVILADFFNSIQKIGSCRMESIYRATDDLLFLYSKELKLYSKGFIDIPGFEGFLPQHDIRKFEFLEDLKDWMVALTLGFFDFVASIKDSGQRSDIRKSLAYIYDNYSSKLTIKVMARHVNMSENYFCHLFKKEVGEGFTDYLTAYRINKAKELLKSTDMRINEIADKVGFENIYYFSNVFKKLVGLSPVEYKKR